MPHLFGQSQPKPLRVRAVTFNMAKKMPTDLPEELLGRAGCPEGLDKYDIVVIGTQESGSSQVLIFLTKYTQAQQSLCACVRVCVCVCVCVCELGCTLFSVAAMCTLT